MTDLEAVFSQGWGDGHESEQKGAIRCSLSLNTTHKHLPGDFICRKKYGGWALVRWEEWERIHELLEKEK